MKSESDKGIHARYLAADPAARRRIAAELLRAVEPAIAATVRRYGRWGQADDEAQEARLDLLAALQDRTEPIDDWPALARTILSRRAIDRLRQERIREDVEGEPVEDIDRLAAAIGPDMEQAIDARQQVEDLLADIEALPTAAQRDALLAALLDEPTPDGVTAEAMRARRYRARQRLRS